MSQSFEVGKTYRNRNGEYVVQALEGDRMKIRYASGGTLVTKVDLQARIWENIQLEEQIAREEERRRLAREARREARRRTRQKKKPEFKGFVEDDFETTKRRIAWSGREDMGRYLSFELRRYTRGAFRWWIVPRESGVHVARKQHFSRDIRDRVALFFVLVDPDGVSYGLRVTKPDEEEKADSHWAGFVSGLRDSEQVREDLYAAMERHGLSIDIYCEEQAFTKVAGITVEDEGFLWQHETVDQKETREMDWEDLIDYLKSQGSGKRCHLYVRKQFSVEGALKGGAGMASEISSVFKSLAPLYDVSIAA